MIKQYIVDAFTDKVFHGNQAAICVPDRWIPEDLMMDITKENNFSETAFTVKEGDRYHLRWFTPGGEIDLCGHATLACAFVLFRYYEKQAERVVFSTMSGDLAVEKKDDWLEMEFPAYTGRDLLCVFDDEETVRQLAPDMEKAVRLDGLLLHATAPGKEADCVSRSFAPKLRVTEDPVCGSGHCHIIPYWAGRTGRKELAAYQASQRGGTLRCRMDGKRVFMAGKAVLYSVSELQI